MKPVFRTVKTYLILTLGSLIAATAYNLFLVPNKIAPGGVGGIGTVLYHLYSIPVGVSMLVMNVPLFLLSIKFLGGRFGIKTFFATIALSVAIDLTSFLPSVTDDLLLAGLFGGLILGFGLGIVFTQGATTGGTDIAAKLAHRWLPHISIGTLLLFIDMAVVFWAAVVFRNYQLALYAVITLFVIAKVLDAVLEGVDFAKAVYVISEKNEEIAGKIMDELARGVTGFKIVGKWTQSDREMLLCVVRRREVPRIKRIVRDLDPRAFVFLADVREVLGEGFKAME
ncbi:MAG: YitT family protein [Spirochaetales bacterium]|nr:YitT family protein [Spirochaetales bacterium]